MDRLETARLVLRPFDEEDIDFVFDMYRRHEVRRFIGSGRVMIDRNEAVQQVQRWMVFDEADHGVWLIADRHDGTRFGAGLLKSLPASGPNEPLAPSGETEVGWHLHPDAWGRGIATEAARRMLKYAFGRRSDRVLAVTNPVNIASQAVARRIGMRDMGLTDAYYNTTCTLFRIRRTDFSSA